MNFFNPTVLFGLIAASIPLILHIINLRKLKKVEFSSLKFLKELQKTRIKRLKIKRLLLLILRTLAIASIVIAFARPTIDSPLPLLSNYSTTSTVILLDNSASMNISDAHGNRFNQAKNEVRRILTTRKEGDETAIIPLSTTANSSIFGNILSRNSEYVRAELDNMPLGYSVADLDRGIRSAVNLLHNSLNFTREIFIVSDLQSNVLRNLSRDSSKFAVDVSNFFMFPVGSDTDAGNQVNVSVDSVHLITQIFRSDSPVEAEAIIHNHSTQQVSDLVVSLYFNNQRTAQRSINLQPGEKKTIAISAIPKSAGLNSARIEIESDALDEDNCGYFGFIIPARPKVALVSVPGNSKFLHLSLSAKLHSNQLIDIKDVTPANLSSLDLNKFDIIVCGSGQFRETDFQRLRQYVSNGGSLMLFANSSVSPEMFSRGLSDLGFGAFTERLFSNESPAQFTKVDRNHPIFRNVFKTSGDREIVESPKIRKAHTLAGGLEIIQIPGGSFLAESRVGDGKVLYCAVTPDAEWSNLPFTGIFPIMMYRAMSYLSSNQDAGISIKAGEAVTVQVPKKYAGYSNFRVVDPNKNETFVQASVLPSGSVISLPAGNFLGNYQIFTHQNEPVAIVSVNHERSESDLTMISQDVTKDYIKHISGENTSVKFIDSDRNLADVLNSARIGTELWQLFIGLALFCLLAEMLVAKNTKFETEEEN